MSFILQKQVKCVDCSGEGTTNKDAIIINERLVKEDILTSIHIKEFEVEIRDTKRGEEELTNEIPNVSEEATRNLDARGIVRVGAEVKSGDILGTLRRSSPSFDIKNPIVWGAGILSAFKTHEPAT